MAIEILLSTRKHAYRQAIDVARRLGFDGVELIMHHDNHRDSTKEAASLSADEQKLVKAIHAPTGDFALDHFQKAVSRSLSLADKLPQVSVINVHPTPLLHGGRKTVEAGIDYIKKTMRKKKKLITWEILPFPRKEKHIRQQAYASLKDLIKDAVYLQLPVTLDTTHVASWGEDPALCAQQLGRHLRHVHVSDYDRLRNEQHLLLGQGNLNFGPLFEILRALDVPTPLFVTLEQAGYYDLTQHQGSILNSLRMMRELLGQRPPHCGGSPRVCFKTGAAPKTSHFKDG